MGLKEGDYVPEFTAINDIGEDFQSNLLIGKKLLYFIFIPKTLHLDAQKKLVNLEIVMKILKIWGQKLSG